jgi:hypothetical protein
VRCHVIVHERAESLGELVVRAAQRRDMLAVDKYGAVRRFAGPGRLMPMLAAFDSPGPLTTQPITASVSVSTPSYRVFHSGMRLRM